MSDIFARRGALVALTLALAACATPVPPATPVPAALTTATPEQMVALIRAAVNNTDNEFAVHPLRDPAVEDLRAAAQRLEAQRNYAEAANACDQALAIVPEDPALLQQRAELALLLKDYAGAESRAKRAFEIGAQLGPLCRRHWATIEQVRLHAGDADGAATAKREIAGCKVAALNRF
ncbi:MAG: hypothetical protein ACREO8_05850 [Luteimonas sp.]